jgi:hypothetical protein
MEKTFAIIKNIMAAKKKSTKATTTAKKATTTKVKKAPIKKVIATIPQEEVLPIITPIEVETNTTMPSTATPQFRIKKGYVVTVFIILIVIGLLYAFRSQFIVATVNGQPISRAAFNAEMQKEAGKKSMDALVTKSLILQEAEKKNISVSDDDVNKQVKTIQTQLSKQGQNLNQALTMQGLTVDDLKEQIKIEKILEKLLASKIKVSDKEINGYMQQQSQSPDATASGGLLSKDEVKQQLTQNKLTEQAQPWLQSLQQNAKISYFLNL